MAAVVDDDVDARKAPPHLGEKLPVRLVADQDADAILLERPAARVDVEADDLRARAEVLAPHLQRAAVEHADFQHHRRSAAEGGEVTVVDLEVVVPLLDQPAGIAAEIGLERVGRFFARQEQRTPDIREDAPEHSGRVTPPWRVS